MANSEKHILVPFDFSDYSFNAGIVGMLLAKENDADVIFLNVSEHDFPTITTTRFIDIEKQYKSLSINGLADVNRQLVCKKGIPEIEIVKYAAQINPLMVIMATRGKDHKQRDMIGSVTAEVMEKLQQPLLVIPESSKENVDIMNITEIKHAGFATGFSTPDITVFEKMMQMISKRKVDLKLIHVLEHREKESDFSRQISRISEHMTNNYPEIEFSTILKAQTSKDVAMDINRIVSDYNIDFLTMKNPRNNELKNFFVASLVQKLIYNASIPLLIL